MRFEDAFAMWLTTRPALTAREVALAREAADYVRDACPGAKRGPKGGHERLADRDKAMCAAFAAGQTSGQVSDTFGVTRQRVHQIIKRYGLDGSNGDASVGRPQRAAARADRLAAARADRDARYTAKTGISLDERDAIRGEFGPRPFLAYIHQRKNANARGIPWEFNFASWWAVWVSSGEWTRRGRGHGYCMARKGDVGPYAADNVYICTASDNTKDSYINKPYHTRSRPQNVAPRG